MFSLQHIQNIVINISIIWLLNLSQRSTTKMYVVKGKLVLKV